MSWCGVLNSTSLSIARIASQKQVPTTVSRQRDRSRHLDPASMQVEGRAPPTRMAESMAEAAAMADLMAPPSPEIKLPPVAAAAVAVPAAFRCSRHIAISESIRLRTWTLCLGGSRQSSLVAALSRSANCAVAPTVLKKSSASSISFSVELPVVDRPSSRRGVPGPRRPRPRRRGRSSILPLVVRPRRCRRLSLGTPAGGAAAARPLVTPWETLGEAPAPPEMPAARAGIGDVVWDAGGAGSREASGPVRGPSAAPPVCFTAAAGAGIGDVAWRRAGAA